MEGLGYKFKKIFTKLIVLLTIGSFFVVPVGNNNVSVYAHPPADNICDETNDAQKLYFSPEGMSVMVCEAKDTQEKKEGEWFDIVSTSNLRFTIHRDIGRYIYKSRSRDFYIAIDDSIYPGAYQITHHYKVAEEENLAWDANPSGSTTYTHAGTWPDEADKMTRTVISGIIQIGNKPINEATVHVRLYNSQGPQGAGPIVVDYKTEKIDDQDGAFSFRDTFINGKDFFLNQNLKPVKLVVYAQKEDEDTKKKFEGVKVITFPDDFRDHRNDRDSTALVDQVYDPDKKFEDFPLIISMKELSSFSLPESGRQTLLKETFDVPTVGDLIGNAIEKAAEVLLNAMIELAKLVIDKIVTPALRISFGVEKAYALDNNQTSGEKQETLRCDINPQCPEHQAWIVEVWQFSLSLVNIVVIAVLILIAFANILHMNVDTYAIKKSLPGLILGVILANLSLFISRLIVEVADVLYFTVAYPGMVGDLMRALGLGSFVGGAATAVGFVALFIPGTQFLSLALILLGIILLFLPVIGLAILGFLFYFRTAIVWFLVSISPLAFVSLALPFGQTLFKRWWSEYLKWVFMAPLAMFLLRLLAIIGKVSHETNVAGLNWGIHVYIISLGLLYLAILVPFKMGGAAMAIWGKVGKGAAGFGWGKFNNWIDKVSVGLSRKYRRPIALSPRALMSGFLAGSKELSGRYEQQAMGMAKARYVKTLGAPSLLGVPWYRDKEGKVKWRSPFRFGEGPSLAAIQAQRSVISQASEQFSGIEPDVVREELTKDGGFFARSDQYNAEGALQYLGSQGQWDSKLKNQYLETFGNPQLDPKIKKTKYSPEANNFANYMDYWNTTEGKIPGAKNPDASRFWENPQGQVFARFSPDQLKEMRQAWAKGILETTPTRPDDDTHKRIAAALSRWGTYRTQDEATQAMDIIKQKYQAGGYDQELPEIKAMAAKINSGDVQLNAGEARSLLLDEASENKPYSEPERKLALDYNLKYMLVSNIMDEDRQPQVMKNLISALKERGEFEGFNKEYRKYSGAAGGGETPPPTGQGTPPYPG